MLPTFSVFCSSGFGRDLVFLQQLQKLPRATFGLFDNKTRLEGSFSSRTISGRTKKKWSLFVHANAKLKKQFGGCAPPIPFSSPRHSAELRAQYMQSSWCRPGMTWDISECEMCELGHRQRIFQICPNHREAHGPVFSSSLYFLATEMRLGIFLYRYCQSKTTKPKTPKAQQN